MSKHKKIETNDIKDWYLGRFSAFENHLNGSRDIPFHAVRKNALSTFSALGFPGRRDEEWKYTNIAPLLKHQFGLAGEVGNVTEETLRPYLFEGLENNRAVLLNGRYSEALSNYRTAARGVIVCSMKTALKQHAALVEPHLGRHARLEDEAFVALNTAFVNDGVFVYVPDNTVVEEPLHLLFLSDATAHSFFTSPRILLVAGKNSRMKIVETHNGLGDHAYFTNVVTEAVNGAGAKVDYVKLQDERPNAYHISHLQAHQERDSNFSFLNFDIGGRLVRNNLNLALKAENCEGHLIGFYIGGGRQHIDNHTAIDHAMPNCFSNGLYKGILGGKASGVFNGKIFVRQDAQKTNAYQNNKALLLSDDATINSKPQLEIFADDVKCSHGATVGQLDDEALFYLQARGIPKAKAQAMLQYAFASDVFNYIPLESVREKIDQLVHERFDNI